MKREIAVFLIITMVLSLSACGKTLKGTDGLIEKAREEIPISDSDTIDLQYAGMCGNDNRAIAWFISGNEYQKHYYLPMEVEVKEDAAEYTFIRTYKPIDDRIGDIAYIQWGDGYAFIVNNTNCKSVRFTSGNEVYEEVIPDDTYPYVFFYLSDHTNSTLQFEFLDAEGDEHWHDFFYLEITTGLRRGELCGLMWTDFDAEKGTLTVRRTLHNKEGGGYYVGETKTGAGRRIIKLPPSTVQLLSERKRTSISQWIFPNPIHPEDPIMPNSGYTRMKKLLAEAGLPDMRFHDLRHTFATHALTSGVDAKTLSGILGHTKTSFTLDTYTHVTGDMHRKASGIVGEFMSDFVVKG